MRDRSVKFLLLFLALGVWALALGRVALPAASAQTNKKAVSSAKADSTKPMNVAINDGKVALVDTKGNHLMYLPAPEGEFVIVHNAKISVWRVGYVEEGKAELQLLDTKPLP